MSEKPPETSWPDAFVVAIIFIVFGWIIFSVSSCTAKQEQAKFQFMENNKGVAVW